MINLTREADQMEIMIFLLENFAAHFSVVSQFCMLIIAQMIL